MDDLSRHEIIQQLGTAMSDVSEDCYCAGWLGGTEDVLPELASVHQLGSLGCYRAPVGHLWVFLSIDSVAAVRRAT